MRRVHDGIEIVDAEHAEVRDCESTALVLVRGQLALAGASGEVFHLSRQRRQRFGVGILQDRSEQTALDGDGNSHIRRFQLQNPVTRPDGIALGHLLQRVGDGLDDEVVDAELHTPAFELLVQLAAELE